ncbi:MAG TPA: ABC transporter ATP-binding protein [Conexibacter sp.]|nr:ABC transporter ATP-binding protein [Conexibacter sp.]
MSTAAAPPVSARACALRLRDLHVTFNPPDRSPVTAVDGVDLDVRPGERFALVGESGCGKTTTALAAMGLLPHGAEVTGDIRIGGHAVTERNDVGWARHRWTDVAMVFQGAMNSLNPVQPIGRQIVEPMRIHEGVDRKQATRRAHELLELVGIPARRAGAFPHELSGGMRQRTAIAMALACNPRLLVADEPTTALDTMVQAQIFALLVRLTQELEFALLLVTHDLPAVMHFCERAAVMYAGRVVETASVAELYAHPRHPYTRRLFEASPSLDRTGEIRSIPGAPPRLDRPMVGCRFAARCDRAIDRCRVDDPRLETVGEAHEAACWRAREQEPSA